MDLYKLQKNIFVNIFQKNLLWSDLDSLMAKDNFMLGCYPTNTAWLKSEHPNKNMGWTCIYYKKALLSTFIKKHFCGQI